MTGHDAPLIKIGAGEKLPRGVDAVLIGTIGRSPLIDGLIRRHKLDVTAIRGQWESAVTTIVERPMPGVRHALVIAGADKRGTIYGIYDLSEQIGVSPWYWLADVRVPHADALYVEPGRYVQSVPAVKYRGIFFNDEAPALSGWTKEKFGGMNHEFYTKVFELLLRLKANFLWPAMWNNAFAADDPLNPKLADEYGIVMGTSHEEPMMRAEKEWDWGHHGAWDYSDQSGGNRQVLARGDGAGQELRGGRYAGHARPQRHADVGRREHSTSGEDRRRSARNFEADRESRSQQGSAGVGALQRGAGLLRTGHARAGRCDAAVVATTTGATCGGCPRRKRESARAARESTTTSTMWAARARTSG